MTIVLIMLLRIFKTDFFTLLNIIMQKFKQEVLMQYLYGEASTQLTIAIEQALQEDWELQDELNTLRRTIKQLDTLQLSSPRKSTINSILNYAKSTVEVTHG